MISPFAFEPIQLNALLDRTQAFHDQGYRLVQIGATRLTDQIELTYSFDREGQWIHLRLLVPAANARIPSISAIYWCAFIYENELHDLFNLSVDGMAVDFKGHFYQTTVKFPFARVRPGGDQPAATAPASPTPAPSLPHPRS